MVEYSIMLTILDIECSLAEYKRDIVLMRKSQF